MLIVSAVAPAALLWVFSGARCLGCPVGNGGGGARVSEGSLCVALDGLRTLFPGEASAGLLLDPRGHQWCSHRSVVTAQRGLGMVWKL